jgi:hypothetical protein
VRNDEVLHRVKQEINMLKTITERKVNWIDHILRRNYLLKDVNKGKKEGTGDEEEHVSSYWMT